MRRINTRKDALSTGEVEFDVGDDLRFRVPLNRGARIDQTAGRVVKIWDYLNGREQIIYGDTGWRDVKSLLTSGWTAGNFLIRRDMNNVKLRFTGLDGTASTSGNFLTLPDGFRSAATYLTAGVGANPQYFGISAGYNLFTAQTFKQNNYYAEVFFTVDQPWPTVLPGTAVGSIPNV